ncbi:MAG: C40 family peptidase [Lachnospiraceae bacterium]|nr:C40 family peptidase [Lachnospiraceae bacterium]
MISAEGVKRYCAAIHAAGAVYVWGADVEVITDELIEEKKARFGTSHYHDIVLCDVEGKLGADCSGFLTPIAGIDRTAESHYKTCAQKGKAADLPADKVCLLFRADGGRVVHVAVYTGDGMMYEMWDGCEHREFKPSQWTYYGIPAWIEEQEIIRKVGAKITITKKLQRYRNAANAKAGKNALEHPYAPGTFYIYKIDVGTGAVNITKVKGTPGSWVML